MVRLSPVKSIRLYCLNCRKQPKNVRRCPNQICALYEYRLGKNPARKGIGGKNRLLESGYSEKRVSEAGHS